MATITRQQNRQMAEIEAAARAALAADTQKLGQALEKKVVDVLRKNLRPGGVINPTS
jgi:hypothetical protein